MEPPRPPTVVKWGVRVALDAISLREESGWRGAQPTVVAKHAAKFEREYGETLFRNIRLRASTAEGDLDDDCDGKHLLDDGKSTVTALVVLRDKLASTKDGLAGCPNGALREVLLHGVLTDVGALYFGRRPQSEGVQHSRTR